MSETPIDFGRHSFRVDIERGTVEVLIEPGADIEPVWCVVPQDSPLFVRVKASAEHKRDIEHDFDIKLDCDTSAS